MTLGSTAFARRPDFFIVGAPKAGTSSLFAHLGGHPEIHLPRLKEPHFFGADHRRLNHRRLSWAQYMSLFAGADGARRVGEASTSYLHSKLAAEEIAAFSADARIIMMLREPVSMMHALHGEMVATGFECIGDFEAALAAEHDRKDGRLLPRAAAGLLENLFYREMAAYPVQVARYFRVFGRDRVHVIVFDDWTRHTEDEYRRVLDFLEVDPDHRPDLERVVNASKRPRSGMLQRLIFQPPAPIRRAVRALLREGVRGRLRYRLGSLNTVEAARDPLAPALVDRLRSELHSEIDRLERLLGRSLAPWRASR